MLFSDEDAPPSPEPGGDAPAGGDKPRPKLTVVK
jgi:hypothetical protein